MDDSWTIAELTELAAGALATSGMLGPETPATTGGPEGELDGGSGARPVRASGRVRDVPNERLIRWYGTVGLVDPPLSRRGRVARYGQRHLLQLVAVKRRQADGKSLAEIQAELAGLPDEALAAIAGVAALAPGPVRHGSSSPAAGATPPAAAVSGRFWARQPEQPVSATPATRADQDEDSPTAALVYGIRLAPGATLLIDSPGRDLSPEDMAQIVNAARPMLEVLANRGLAAPARSHTAEPDKGSGT